MPSPGAPPSLPPPILTVQEPSRPSTVHGIVTSPNHLLRPPPLPSPSTAGQDGLSPPSSSLPSRGIGAVSTYSSSSSSFSSSTLEEGPRYLIPFSALKAIRRRLIISYLGRILVLYIVVALVIYAIYRTNDSPKWWAWAVAICIIATLLSFSHLRGLHVRLRRIKEPPSLSSSSSSNRLYSPHPASAGRMRSPMMRINPVTPAYAHTPPSSTTIPRSSNLAHCSDLGLDPLPSYTEASSTPPAYGNQLLHRPPSEPSLPPLRDGSSREAHSSEPSRIPEEREEHEQEIQRSQTTAILHTSPSSG